MRPRADDPSLDKVRTGTPQSTAARSSWALVSESSVVAHLAQSLDQHFRVCLLSLLIFWEVIHRWTLVSEMSGGKLLVSHWQTWGGGWSRSQGSFQVGGGGRGEAAGVPPWVGGPGGCRRGWGGPGEKGSRQRCERGGGGRGKRQVVGCQTWSTVAASCRSPEGRPERGQPGVCRMMWE